MNAIFFTTKGLAIQVLIPKGKSMDAKFFRKKNLRMLVKFYQKRQSKTGICGICLSRDNALSHKTGSMTSFLKEQGDFFSGNS